MSSNDVAISCLRWRSRIEVEWKTFLEHNITINPQSKFPELEGLEEMVLKWLCPVIPVGHPRPRGSPSPVLEAMYFEQIQLLLHKLNNEVLIDLTKKLIELFPQVVDFAKLEQVAQTLAFQAAKLVQPAVMQSREHIAHINVLE